MMRKECLNKLSDEELVTLCEKSEVAVKIIISRYLRYIRSKANGFSKSNFDSDDLMQEGLLGLLNAIRTYKRDGDTKFFFYASICITNKMKTLLMKDDFHDVLLDEFYDKEEYCQNPESIIVQKEDNLELTKKVSLLLSHNEWNILRLFLVGMSYDQIATQLDIHVRTVDNALQRARKKLKTVWYNE